jgi:glycerate-2-kinase
MRFTDEEMLIANGCTPSLRTKRRDILTMLAAAIDAADPSMVVAQTLEKKTVMHDGLIVDLSSFAHIDLVAFGKASLKMAQAAQKLLSIRRGVVISPTPAPPLSDTIEVVVGGHPLPTQGSIQGAEKALTILSQEGDTDLVLILISGGGSSLFEKPCVPLEDLRRLTTLLLASGASIDELNIIRRHLSLVKGGQLIPKTKATIVSLIISDVVHDPLESIASGPTAPDPSTFQDAVDVLIKYDLLSKIPSSITEYLFKGVSGSVSETLKPGDPAFTRVHNLLIANNSRACHAAATTATSLGYTALVPSTTTTGEARTIGDVLVHNAKEHPMKHLAIITGGETTVRVTGHGQGGRNQELVLGAVRQLAGTDFVLASCATDGVDGNSPAAGALADGCTLTRAQKAGLDPDEALRHNDSYPFFIHLHDSLHCGPTGTNVMDLCILLE